LSKAPSALTVALDLKLPEDQIAEAELDLIEAHFAELLRQILDEAETPREVIHGSCTVRTGLDDEASG
jgi:hypothetical protein